MTERFEASNADFARVVRDSFARQGLMSTLGARIVALEPGLCVIEMDYAPGVSQQNGYFHGGAVGAIADSAAGYAAYSLMPAGSDILTVEYKLKPDPPGGATDRPGRGTRGTGRQDAERVPRRCLLHRQWASGGLRAAAIDLDAAGAIRYRVVGPRKGKLLQSHQSRPK
jgi:hypothetical protein